METIEKQYQIPSNGLFGGPKEITLRAMTTKEEKILLSSRDFSVFERLLKSCCIEPKDLDIGLLHQNDIMYLIYALRELTFGSTYIQEVECPECGFKQDAEIDISKMKVNILDTDNIEERLVCKLPMNKDTLQLKVLSYGESNTIDRQVKALTNKGKLQDPDSYNFTLKLMNSIVTKNGEDFESEDDKKNYVNNLHLKDLITIQNTLADIDFGLDNTNTITCSKCNEDIEVNGLICPEFFRPSK